MKRLITIIPIFLTAAPALFALPAAGLQSARANQPSVTVRRTTAVAPVATTTAKPGASASREQSLLARVTVYWAKGGKGSDPFTRRHQSAIGQRLHTGHCAVDPTKIPYGSRVVLPTGETLAAVDTGTAVKSRKAARQSGHTTSERSALVVDRFFETKGQALAWANSHPLFMPVRVVRPGSQVAMPQQIQIRKAQRVDNGPVTQTAQTTVVASNQTVASAGTAARNPLKRIGR